MSRGQTATTPDEEPLDVEATTESLTKTIICKLETSNAKNEAVRWLIDEWQAVARRIAELMPSVDPDEWRTQSLTLYHLAQNEIDHDLRASDAGQAAYKVGEAFNAWDSNGRPGERPIGDFGDADWARIYHDGVRVEQNDRGYGLRVPIRPYVSEWFHIDAGPYQREYLRKIVSDANAHTTGSAELHLTPDGSLFAHLSVNTSVDVLEADALDRWVGVCLGESVIRSAALTAPDGAIDAVDMEPGAEFRHHRERFKRKRQQLMEAGDLRRFTSLRDEHRRYTEYIAHRAARRIVDFAAEHAPCGIRLEDLTHLRETAPDPIHDFPYAEIQENVVYKATEAGLPVEFVRPHYTKQTCRKCGHTAEENRDGNRFHCADCGYEVHAFVNGAANVALSSS